MKQKEQVFYLSKEKECQNRSQSLKNQVYTRERYHLSVKTKQKQINNEYCSSFSKKIITNNKSFESFNQQLKSIQEDQHKISKIVRQMNEKIRILSHKINKNDEGQQKIKEVIDKESYKGRLKNCDYSINEIIEEQIQETLESSVKIYPIHPQKFEFYEKKHGKNLDYYIGGFSQKTKKAKNKLKGKSYQNLRNNSKNRVKKLNKSRMLLKIQNYGC